MNKIFSAVALAATVATLTLASADVLASNGKGKDAKGSSHNTSQSSGPGNSSGKGKGSDNSKGHNHNHSNGNGHANHQGNGYGHDHDDDDDDDDSCEASDGDSGNGNGHNKHKGKGHQHDHTGYINGKGHHKHHNHDDDSCGGGDDDDDDDNGGGDNGGGDDDDNGVVLPAGCYAAAAFSENSFADAFGSTRFGFVLNADAAESEFNTNAVDATGMVLGTFGIVSVSADDFLAVSLSTATGYQVRDLSIYSGELGSYTVGTTAQFRWTGADVLKEFTLTNPASETLELVITATICEANTDYTPPN